jgi:hypothetical protein
VPFFKTVAYPLGIFGFIVLTYFVIVGTSNAVNLTDGLDGLAIMPTVMVGGALASSPTSPATPLLEVPRLPYIPGAGELTVFCGALAGRDSASSGSTPIRRKSSWATSARWRWAPRSARWRHRAPGDRAVHHGRRVRRRDAVGDAAGRWFYFKLTGGKRIFRMAPLHHHYELKGWKETQVVVRFWIITIMLVLFGLSTLKSCDERWNSGKRVLVLGLGESGLAWRWWLPAPGRARARGRFAQRRRRGTEAQRAGATPGCRVHRRRIRQCCLLDGIDLLGALTRAVGRAGGGRRRAARHCPSSARSSCSPGPARRSGARDACKVLAITGTNGKTTTTALTGASVAAPPANA